MDFFLYNVVLFTSVNDYICGVIDKDWSTVL